MLPASEVARTAGLTLHRRGSREWACCPLHREKTPSLCFYPDGRFHCFGCGAHGDAADLHRALYGGTIGEALRAVGKERRPRWDAADRSNVAQDGRINGAMLLRRRVETYKAAAYHDACAAYHLAGEMLRTVEGLHTTPQEAAADPLLWQAVALREQAARRLDELCSMTPQELMNDLAERTRHDRLEHSRSNPRRAIAHPPGMAPALVPARPAEA